MLLTDSLGFAFTDEVAALFLGAIAAELAPTGFALTLLSAAVTEHGIPARDVPMDGALVYSCTAESPALGWLHRRRLPLVYVDQVPVDDIDSVNVDDRAGAALAAQHLVDLGHRRVGIVTANVDGPAGIVDDPVGAATNHVSRERMRGWLDALGAAGIRPTVVQQLRSGDHAGREGARTLLSADPRPTAILCFSDATASGVLQAADEFGLVVPRDLSVVGFDDNPLAHASSRRSRRCVRTSRRRAGRPQPLSRLRSSARRAGTTAPARHVLLPTELVVRKSTAPPR